MNPLFGSVSSPPTSGASFGTAARVKVTRSDGGAIIATLQQIKDQIDAKLAQLWPAVQSKQDAYLAANGRYWQGLALHSTYPADGNEALPDIGTRTPTDQPGQPWPTALRTTAMPMTIRVDCYDGPNGSGFTATVYVRVTGKTYTRTAHAGPEAWRIAGWRQLVEATP